MLSFIQIPSNLENWTARLGPHFFLVMEDMFEGNFIALTSDESEFDPDGWEDPPPPHIIGRGFETAAAGKAACEEFAKSLPIWTAPAANDA